MGFRWRRRTGGKNAWFNWSASKGNGFGGSVSFKVGNATINLKGGRRRITYNLGNGLFYTKQYTPKKKQVKSKVQIKESVYKPTAEELKEANDYYAWFNSLTKEEQITQVNRLKYHANEIKKLVKKQEWENEVYFYKILILIAIPIIIIIQLFF